MTRAEAARLAEGNPHSFLHVGRSDIDLPPETDPHDPAVYAAARSALDRFRRDGTLVRDPDPALYVYELTWRGQVQRGVVGCVHIDDYASDVIRKHERTRPDKEDDRTRHVLTLDANAEPVFLTYPADAAVDRVVDQVAAREPLCDFIADDDVRHRVWTLSDPAAVVRAFESIPVAYVADGHHRSASAWRAGTERRAANPSHTGAEPYNWFLAVLFPSDQVSILPYNRVVRDLGGVGPGQVRERLAALGEFDPVSPEAAAPDRAGQFGIYLDGQWHRLTLTPDPARADDPVASLDAAMLQDQVLGPVLGIGDPRTDPRIDFVGGIRGTADLSRRVDNGEAALAVAMAPVTVEQLMAIADRGGIMPPKSTWFEPKLRSGLFVHTLDENGRASP